MLHILKLLLPALIPSWRFFDVIAPSPRIEFTLLKSLQDTTEHWHELRARPLRLSFMTVVRRLFWNPHWNESLFLVSCAERMMENPTDYRNQEILMRIKSDLRKNNMDAATASYLQFRLVFISRHGAELHKDILFVSPLHLYEDVVV